MAFDYSQPHKIVNGNPVALTDAEISARAVDDAAFVAAAPARAKVKLETAVQVFLDSRARASGYDDIRSAISYRGDRNAKWASEAELFAAWRSDVWAKCIAIQTDVLAGKQTIPTAGELLAMLPALVLP